MAAVWTRKGTQLTHFRCTGVIFYNFFLRRRERKERKVSLTPFSLSDSQPVVVKDTETELKLIPSASPLFIRVDYQHTFFRTLYSADLMHRIVLEESKKDALLVSPSERHQLLGTVAQDLTS
jgi:hypothetical protein